MRVEVAKKAHGCKHNEAHTIAAGDKRLSVAAGMSRENYCVPCALEFLERDVASIKSTMAELRGPM